MQEAVTSDKQQLILLVDDTPQNLSVLANVLKNENCRIAAATSGAQALESALKYQPDLILLDVMMPEMDGYEVCTKLKANPQTMAIPVIFLTARIETDDIVRGFETGAMDYISKPFNSAELLARVRTHLRLKKAQDNEKKLIAELTASLEEIQTLSGMLPICANCKKIRDDQGYWQQLDEYMSEHSNVRFSHGICPECTRLLYPELAERLLNKQKRID